MKPLYKIFFAGSLITLLGIPSSNAQDSHMTGDEVRSISSVKQDKVKADLTNTADKKDKDFYLRSATVNENGTYSVIIKDKNEQLRMTGTYLDNELTIADGEFIYYYSNGNVESTGRFANGLKMGTWARYHADGTPKAEKNYSGMTWEDMAVSLGVASKAESH